MDRGPHINKTRGPGTQKRDDPLALCDHCKRYADQFIDCSGGKITEERKRGKEMGAVSRGRDVVNHDGLWTGLGKRVD